MSPFVYVKRFKSEVPLTSWKTPNEVSHMVVWGWYQTGKKISVMVWALTHVPTNEILPKRVILIMDCVRCEYDSHGEWKPSHGWPQPGPRSSHWRERSDTVLPSIECSGVEMNKKTPALIITFTERLAAARACQRQRERIICWLVKKFCNKSETSCLP